MGFAGDPTRDPPHPKREPYRYTTKPKWCRVVHALQTEKAKPLKSPGVFATAKTRRKLQRGKCQERAIYRDRTHDLPRLTLYH